MNDKNNQPKQDNCIPYSRINEQVLFACFSGVHVTIILQGVEYRTLLMNNILLHVVYSDIQLGVILSLESKPTVITRIL